MKIILVGLSSNGHRKTYLEYIYNSVRPCAQVILLCPESSINDFVIADKRFLKTTFHKKRTLKAYLRMLRQIQSVAVSESADIIHFLDADEIYRYFGIGLSCLSQFQVVMTFHHLYINNWRRYAIHRIMEKIDCSIVHTNILAEYFSSLVKHSVVKHIEYPAFDYDELREISSIEAKKELGLPSDYTIVGLLGRTSDYKGYHFLLENLSGLSDHQKKHLHFFFAGEEGEYKYEQIKKNLRHNNVTGTTIPRKLTTHEFQRAVQASDIILLPYGKSFNGASGPLAEGVCAGKMIIGSDYESLGALIRDNHIGYTFEAENGNDLIRVLNELKRERFIYDQTAVDYQKSLNPTYFGNSYSRLYCSLMNSDR